MVAVPSIGRADQVTPRRGAPEADATRDLYERYARQIHAYCMHQLGNREEAEDAVQSTFLNAFRGLKRGVDPEFESAWLYKIAENVCLTRQRSSSRRRRIESPGDLDAIQDILPSHQPDRDELIRLPEALEEMPEQQRRALLLREWQGLSYKEIAAELDLSQAAVETLLFRARRSLASGLTEEPKEKKTCVARKLRAGSDLGSVVALLKTLIFSGGVKVAASVAAVAATSMVAATPAIRHTLEQAVAPSHSQQPKPHAVVPKAAARSLSTPAGLASSPVSALHSSASGALAARSSLRLVRPVGPNGAGNTPVTHVGSPYHAPAEGAPEPTAVAPTEAPVPAPEPVSTPATVAPVAAPAESPRASDSPGKSPSGAPSQVGNDAPQTDPAVLTPDRSHAQSTTDKAEVKAAREVAKADAKAANGNGNGNGKSNGNGRSQRDIASASPSVSDPTAATIATTTTTTTPTAAPVANAPTTPPGQAKKDNPAPTPAPAPAVPPTPVVDASATPQPAPAAPASGSSKTERGNGNGHRK